MKLWPLLFGLVVLIKAQTDYQYDYDDYDYEEEPDPCNYYDSGENRNDCVHQKFPNVTLQQLFTPSVSTCCKNHAYLFYDNCPERRLTHETLACGDPTKASVPDLPHKTISCPLNCKRIEIAQDQFRIQADGQLQVQQDGVSVYDYCLAYHCHSREPRSWSVKAITCVCSDQEEIRKVDKVAPETLERCCPDSIQVQHDRHSNKLTCPVTKAKLKTESDPSIRSCDGEWMEIRWKDVNWTALEDHGMVQFMALGRGIRRHVPMQSIHTCVGVHYSRFNHKSAELEPAFFYCHEERCGGKEPCIATCCAPNEMFNSFNATCDPISDNVKVDALTKLNDWGVARPHFEKASPKMRNNCPKYHQRRTLRPESRCNDRFDLLEDPVSGQVNLITQNGIKVPPNGFCLNFQPSLNMSAEVCLYANDNTKFNYYAVILLINSFLFLLTFAIYTAFPKLLSTSYSRLMRHFVVAMFAAFLVLSINQFVSFRDTPVLCQLSAYLNQYLFLTAFSFMTILSVEIFFLMREKGRGSTKRYRLQMICGYLFPLLVSFITLLVEIFGQECAWYRPRFGEETCFFTDKWSKFLLFYLPISLMLVVSLFMFVWVVKVLLGTERQKRRLHLREANKRSDKMNKFIIYLKLFLGMGFIWTFEIVAAMSDSDQKWWYVTDFLNMSQGAYVFISSVCNRKVLQVIFNERTRPGKMLSMIQSQSGQSKAKSKARDRLAPHSTATETKDTDLPLTSFKAPSQATAEDVE